MKLMKFVKRMVDALKPEKSEIQKFHEEQTAAFNAFMDREREALALKNKRNGPKPLPTMEEAIAMGEAMRKYASEKNARCNECMLHNSKKSL